MSLNLKVIGAGIGRTGTTSLKEALTLLLDGSCFHFLEFKTHPALMSEWLAFTSETQKYKSANMSGPESIPLWASLLPGYIACVDEPASWYWQQLWNTFPNALVILSIRDSDSWWESVKSVTLQIKKEKSQPELLSKSRKAYLDFLFTLYPGLNEELSRENSVNAFESHNRKVLAFAEQNEKFKQRLLIWRPSDGWEPICAALNLPVPDVPFPHKNRRTEYHGY